MCNQEDAIRLKSVFDKWTGGNIVITVPFEGPYKCPQAPFEWAFIIDLLLRDKSEAIRKSSTITVTTALPTPVPVSSPTQFMEEMKSLSIEFIGGVVVEKVEEKLVKLNNGRELPADVVIAMQQQAAPPVLLSATGGFAVKAGYICTDSHTLCVPNVPNVYCIGDCAFIQVPAMQGIYIYLYIYIKFTLLSSSLLSLHISRTLRLPSIAQI